MRISDYKYSYTIEIYTFRKTADYNDYDGYKSYIVSDTDMGANIVQWLMTTDMPKHIYVRHNGETIKKLSFTYSDFKDDAMAHCMDLVSQAMRCKCEHKVNYYAN